MAILRRRPVLRAAAIRGGAYTVGRNRTARRRLEELAELHARGDLSDQEFARQKAAVLAEGASLSASSPESDDIAQAVSHQGERAS